MLAAEGVVALIARLVCPRLDSVPMLQVVLPHALVLGPIHVLVNTATVGLVVSPVSIIDVPINMDKAALTMGPILTPLTAVSGSIVPRLLAHAIPEATLPLALVDGP